MKGTIVGSYRILDTISVGGMGTVYRAEHTLIGRLAAVKILHPELCANRSMVNRFFNEAKATTSINHPGIVEVFDFGYMPSGHAYLIMEYLEGMPLSHRVRARGPIPEGEAALLLRSVCIALAAAHDKGIVHRDLKPDNIFVVPDADSALGERTKILDFGIAKLNDIGLANGTTKTGAVMGTPTYMSPEQCRGTGDVDYRADLYSIGCMFYELVAGRPPFTNAGAGEAIGSHLFVNPEPPSRFVANLSRDTEALILKLLAKQPEHRVQSAKELASLLTLIAQQHGWMALGEISRPGLHAPVGSSPGLVEPAAAYTPVLAPTTLEPTTVTPPGLAGAPPSLPGAAPSFPGAAPSFPGAAPSFPGAAPSFPGGPPATALLTQKPTTLSGAASEIREPPRRSRLRLAFGFATCLILVGGGIGALVWFSDATTAPASSAATSPSGAPAGEHGGLASPATAPAAPLAKPTVAPTPVPPTPAEPAPAAAPSAASAAEPTPAAAPSAGPTAAAPSDVAAPSPATTTRTPPEPSPSSAPAPTAASPDDSPAARPPAPPSKSAIVPPKPATVPAKPVKKPRKPDKGSASENKELLEQDI